MKSLKYLTVIIVGAAAGVGVYQATKTKRKKAKEAKKHVPHGAYEAYLKRPFDYMAALLALLFLWPVLGIVALLVRIKLGSPVIFTQERPGRIDPETGKEKIFKLYKFRTMTDARDENGELLPDGERLTEFGKKLRETSLDELLELFNILRGEMSLVGPRPLLVRDMVFMSDEVRRRHSVRPGLSGLAQVMGRNSISWEEKFEWDMRYIEKVSFLGDVKIVWRTFRKVFGKGESSEELNVTDDYGDALLKAGKISQEEYEGKQREAENIIQHQCL